MGGEKDPELPFFGSSLKEKEKSLPVIRTNGACVNRPLLLPGIKSTDQLWFSASGVVSGEGLRTGNIVCPYGENLASADSKYGGSICDSTNFTAATKPG